MPVQPTQEVKEKQNKVIIEKKQAVGEMHNILTKRSTCLWCSFQSVLFISLHKCFDSFLLIPTRFGAEKLFGQPFTNEYAFYLARTSINVAAKQIERLGISVPKSTSCSNSAFQSASDFPTTNFHSNEIKASKEGQ